MGFPYNYGDELTETKAVQNLKNSIGSSKHFSFGFLLGLLLFIPGNAFAIELPRNTTDMSIAEIKKGIKISKDSMGRIANGGACALSSPACAAAMQRVAQGQGGPTAVLMGFGCGFYMAWCVKYMIFDR